MDKLKNKVVAIVDDEESNVYALRNYLEAEDMKTVVAKNGEELIRLLKGDAQPDIILLDMMMPVMDGYETLSILKENVSFKQIPVIAVTARAMKGDKEKCLEAGAWDYIAKPLDIKLLIDKLTHWII
jgi:two-component system chemotaxis sensor kinase CheA